MPAKKIAKKAAKPTAKRGGAAAPKPRAPRAAPGAPAPVLRPLPIYEFTAGDLLGYARLTDPGRGFEFSGCAKDGPLPAVCKEVLSLRHYLARGDGGLLTPREALPCEAKADKHTVVFRYEKTTKWPVETTARYELLAAGGLDASFDFRFAKEVHGFEAGIETFIPKTYSGLYLHSGGRWLAAPVGPRLKRFYPRNLGAAELIADGRWSGLRLSGLSLAIEPDGYDYPLFVLWEPGRELALAYMGLTEDCTSIWVNGADRTIGVGLLGSTVKAGATATCRLRARLCRISDLDDVLPHYRDFVQHARATRKK
jgi:hypothetical protein